MANGKRRPRSRQPREPRPADLSSHLLQFVKEILPLVRCSNLPGRRSAKHLRRAAIEVLTAMRALLDETIDWLEQEEKKSPELKRIRVEG